jgi:hypothetical protein
MDPPLQAAKRLTQKLASASRTVDLNPITLSPKRATSQRTMVGC